MPTTVHANTCTPRFVGDLITKWLPDGRNMKLMDSFEFIDSQCRRWPVPAGSITDGASIPPVFWSIIGGPFEDKYRDAAALHDFYCDSRTRTWKNTHGVFYEAMLTRGVNSKRAWIMYQAVYEFGPRWPDPPIDDPRCDVVDVNYDFSLCSQNTKRPDASWPKLDRGSGNKFLDRMARDADPADVEKLKAAINAL
jgi:hypothetical protein